MAASPDPPNSQDRAAPDSSTGLDPNIAGALCYLVGFVTGIVFLVIEKRDRCVRFHAYQSVGTFGTLFVLSFLASALPFIGWILALILTPISLILWIVLMVKAFQGERFSLPVVGDWAEERAG